MFQQLSLCSKLLGLTHGGEQRIGARTLSKKIFRSIIITTLYLKLSQQIFGAKHWTQHSFTATLNQKFSFKFILKTGFSALKYYNRNTIHHRFHLSSSLNFIGFIGAEIFCFTFELVINNLQNINFTIGIILHLCAQPKNLNLEEKFTIVKCLVKRKICIFHKVVNNVCYMKPYVVKEE